MPSQSFSLYKAEQFTMLKMLHNNKIWHFNETANCKIFFSDFPVHKNRFDFIMQDLSKNAFHFTQK